MVNYQKFRFFIFIICPQSIYTYFKPAFQKRDESTQRVFSWSSRTMQFELSLWTSTKKKYTTVSVPNRENQPFSFRKKAYSVSLKIEEKTFLVLWNGLVLKISIFFQVSNDSMNDLEIVDDNYLFCSTDKENPINLSWIISKFEEFTLLFVYEV